MLTNLLDQQFHPYVLLTGIGLTLIAFTRGWILWQQSRDPSFRKPHDHGHAHDHDHDHPHEHKHPAPAKTPLELAVVPAPAHVHGPACGHEHAPGEACGHDHSHEHSHEHHAHEHHIGKAHVEPDHDEAADHDHGWAPWRYVVILVPIILFLLGLPNRQLSIADTGAERLLVDFVSIVYEAMPFIVLGVLLAGILEEFVPQQALAKLVPRNTLLAIMIGALLGLVFPMCECGIIVVMKRLLRKGLPLGVCVAYMLAGPVINVVVMGSTLVAFGSYNDPGRNDILGGPWQVVAWRVGLSYLVAIVTALVVDWQWQRHGKRLLHPSVLHGLKAGSDEESSQASRPWRERVNNITQTALHDYVDILAFLILGAVLAAGGKFLIKEYNVQDWLQQAPVIAILMMMGIAILFCLCSEADAFVAANFPLFWPDGSKLAFLVLGPMLDFKLLLMYTRVFRGRLIYTIVICLVLQVFLYSSVVNYFFGREHPRDTTGFIMPPDVEPHLLHIGMGPDLFAQLGHFGVSLGQDEAVQGEKTPYGTLLTMAAREDTRNQYKGKVVEVRGEFEPIRAGSEMVFSLSRLKRNCCAGDATTMRTMVVARENIQGYKIGDWIKITARVEFRQRTPTTFETVLKVSKATDVEACRPDQDPFVQ
ncbi:MAG: hypothetical protein EXR98_03360 [Gemmataceae bacterium]|nr:hypothetical protein [Gemmataceae bacterium]